MQSLFDLAPLTPDLTPDTPNAGFHALLRTLAAFVRAPDGPGCLPLSGALPDMRTDTESYVKLQTVYKEQASAEKVRPAPRVAVWVWCVGLTGGTGEVQGDARGGVPGDRTGGVGRGDRYVRQERASRTRPAWAPLE